MIVDLEPRIGNGQRFRNPRPVSHGGDQIIVYQRGSFLDHREKLIALTADFMSQELGWSNENALKTMQKGLSLPSNTVQIDESLIPSVMVFDRNGEVIGVSAQRLIHLDTAIGSVPFLQHLLRAFIPDYRGQGRGTFSVQEAQIIHPQAEFYGHRTQSAAAIQANRHSGIFLPGRYFPIDALYSTDSVMQEVMAAYYVKARANKTGWVDGRTGVSKDDFPQPNESYLPPEPEEQHPDTWLMFMRMQKVWKMRFPSRDVLHGVGQLK